MANTKGNLVSDKRYTCAEFLNLKFDDGERYELINGEAYIKPALTAYHQSIFDKFYKEISEFLADKPIKAFPTPVKVRLFYSEDGDTDTTILLPDVAIYCNPKNCSPEFCKGAPDFIAEIISPAITAIELELKFQIYHKAGIREYWVIDPEHKAISVYNFWDDIIFPKYYFENDKASIGVFEDLRISLDTLFS